MKEKIAISVDKNLLRRVDSKVDGRTVRSRSQSIEILLRKGLEEEGIETAVILLHKSHHNKALKQVRGKLLIRRQLDFFYLHDIKEVLIVTQRSSLSKRLREAVSDSKINCKIVEKEAKGNADALREVKNQLNGRFIVMSGDTYNDFDLNSMMRAHFETDNIIATMGLMERENIHGYGTAILDGNLIVDFSEKPKKATTHVVNAGIYIFNEEVFDVLSKNTSSLEKDLFPSLARDRKLMGFFTRGDYLHI